MKGKNKSFIVLSLLLIVAFGIVCFVKKSPNNVAFANAVEIEGYSEHLEGDVIFSVENVYVANDVNNRNKSLKFGDYSFDGIQDKDDNTIFFGNNGLDSGVANKKVIKNHQYVMIDDKNVKTVQDESGAEVQTRQAVMITMGGYYFDKNGEVVTTMPNALGEKGSANIEVLSITAKRNGQDISTPGIRSINAFVDFVWFLDATSENEGHYELTISYLVQGGNLLRYDFDFYMLLNSSYKDPKLVNGYSYSVSPTLQNVNEKGTSTTINRQYSYFLGEANQFPTLTFDYTRYNLSYVFSSGDTQKKVDFKYDEVNKMLILSTSVYNTVKEDKYPILITSTENANTIVTLMFTEAGKYTFDFDYVYYNLGQRLNIPTTDLDFENVGLEMFGYELMYSKNGFKNAQMQYLEISQNNTMFILVNGFQASNDIGTSLGINYKLITSNEKTGKLLTGSKYTTILNSKTTLNSTNRMNDSDDFVLDETNKWTDDEINNVVYQTTNQGGLWLTLNDNYDLLNSYYYYSTSKITANYINEVENGKLKNVQSINKVTTFTKIGFYLIQARYSYKNEYGATMYKTQYFAFKITSSTPQLDLYKTKATNYTEEVGETATRLYAREFTNQNVFAIWKDADVFESKISATLYYSNGKYPTEDRYRNFISGVETNPDILKKGYEKTSIITESGSYMMMLELENTSTRTYTFFTIDKEGISGIKVYEVATNSIDNRASYSVKRDSNQNYIDYTIRGILDVDFTLNWDDKNSGAKIFGSYTFTPFVKQSVNKQPISEKIGSNSYLYVINNYTVGSTSNSIEFSKPKDLNSSLEIGNVIATQGIYVFTLQDEAGNMVKYIVILDRTDAVIKSVYGDETKEEYISGNIVTKDVSITWGTHKAIELGNLSELGQEIQNVVNGVGVDNYYKESGNNFSNLSALFKTTNSLNLLVVENSKAEIKIQPFDKYQDDYYVLTLKNEQQTVNPKGYVVAGWGELATKLLKAENFATTGYNLTIKKDENRLRNYTVSVISANQISKIERSIIDVCITPDEARGSVWSASQEGMEYATQVNASGVKDSYSKDDTIEIDGYNEGQASNNGLFVFEWLVPKTSDNFTVTKVRYDYFELMDQSVLNSIAEKGLYFPYKYASSEYILNNETGKEVYNYTITTRGAEEFYRSNPINLGPEVYYDTNGNLISRNVTRTGLYIITRSIKASNDSSAKEQDFSYIFFVDRNSIIRYSTSSISEKLVGQFIHNTLPTSEGEIHFDNFAIQGLGENSQKYIENGIENIISYKVYLETNKLPTQLKVPTGKYVSGNINEKDAKSINYTSWDNLKLKLSVYFLDSYKLLPNSSKGAFVKLMDNVTVREDGYIDLTFSGENQGIIADYKKARIHNEDNSLSLPGTYVFVINDTVGTKLEHLQVVDTNIFSFAVKLTKQTPSTDVYAYTQIGSDKSDNFYSVDKTLYTNQGYIDFEIPVEDLKSYDAQLDPYTFEIYRTNNGVKNLWLRLYRPNSSSSYSVDTNGIIQNPNGIIVGVDKDGRETTNVQNIVKYVIKLDSGVGENFENGEFNASSVKEYTYSITVKYVLVNSDEKYYTYLENDERHQFYSSIYNVYIDRTPSTNNINSILEAQKEYFEKYENYLETGMENSSGKLNVNYQYRSSITIQDYYALSNRVFYNFVNSKDYTKVSESMYAINVKSNQTFSKNGLSGLYYRKIDLASEVEADTRMGLMPICDTYFGNSSGFYTFAENLSKYKIYSLASTNVDVEDGNDNVYYWAILGNGLTKGEGFGEKYAIECGVFYEIIEKDLAGNYTQYVIYFEPDEQPPVSLTVKGTVVGNSNDEVTLRFDENPRQTFIGVSETKINNVASSKNAYYGNINIYNSSNELLKKIYINSKTNLENLNSSLLEILQDEKNYIVEYVDVYSNKSYIYIDNYTNTNYSLNTASLVVKTGDNGQKYIELSSVNTKISNDLYCYVTRVDINYDSKILTFTSLAPKNGLTTLKGAGDENVRLVLPDRLNLTDNIQYLAILTDVFNKTYTVTISTSEEYYPYKITVLPENRVERNNVIYTSSMVGISYNNDFYKSSVEIYQNGELVVYNSELIDATDKNVYFNDVLQPDKANYNTITLNPDETTNPDYEGSVRRFVVKLSLKSADSIAQTYEIYIDTRATSFGIENANKESKMENIKSFLNNGVSGQDYDNSTLIQDSYYANLLNETVTISWSRLQSEYFTYRYELLEFENSNTYKNLLENSTVTSYKISPKDKNTTGKYVFKVTILANGGSKWIASRIFTINMSTTVTGLYAVKHNDQEFQYSTITNLNELQNLISLSDAKKDQMATKLKFANVSAMESAFASFGDYTAIPMYISTLKLELHSNKDNGVDAGGYELGDGTTLYHVFKSNYRTFVLVMQVAETDSVLTNFTFSTNDEKEATSLLDGKISRTIYDKEANYYRLNFNSYNKNSQSNGLEKYNKIIIDVYYNGEFSRRITGGNQELTTIEFKNGGNYTLKVSDMAGNIQTFGSINKLDSFTVVLMKELLYTINDSAPIQYAYYDKAVTLKINKSNSATGENNYDGNTITLTAYLNNSNQEYRGYTKLANSYVYIFEKYGTYLIEMTANLYSTGEPITSRIVFTILNPNEARTAMDFTSIYSYNITSVFDISKSVQKDVTEKFVNLLADKSNQAGSSLYNKLITYDRLAEAFGTTQGKMKFKVVYEANDDELLPVRTVEFSFTLNNEPPTISCSIEAGKKTTKPVTIKFNAAILYSQLGECYIVVNGNMETALKIDETSANEITQIQVEDVGSYYIQVVGDSGNIATSFNFVIKEPLNVMSIILITVAVLIVVAIVGTFIWLRTRMKVR